MVIIITDDPKELTNEQLIGYLRLWHLGESATAAQCMRRVHAADVLSRWFAHKGNGESAGKWERKANKLAKALMPMSPDPVRDCIDALKTVAQDNVSKRCRRPRV